MFDDQYTGAISTQFPEWQHHQTNNLLNIWFTIFESRLYRTIHLPAPTSCNRLQIYTRNGRYDTLVNANNVEDVTHLLRERFLSYVTEHIL